MTNDLSAIVSDVTHLPIQPASETTSQPDSLYFLGVGNASAIQLGNASCVLCCGEDPWLMIDCGFDSLYRYENRFDGLPPAVFITHLHFDHVGGIEQLYFRSALSHTQVKLYVPCALVADFCSMFDKTGLAEGGHNVWDYLQIIPVGHRFWHRGNRLFTYNVRHHEPCFCFGLHLPGVVFYSGDTRPIPEIIHHKVCHGEMIFHDCGIDGNPSHTGLGELLTQYSTEALARMVVYHYANESDNQKFVAQGVLAAKPGDVFALPSTGNAKHAVTHQKGA